MTDVTYDRRSLLIDGERTLILSGSVHYVRVHPQRWADLFRTMLDAGLNTIETYVFWNVHEPRPTVRTAASFDGSVSPTEYNFEGRYDLFGFFRAAGEHGLHVILRLGPYVCAEVSYGGFPARLRDLSGIRFRTWNEPFMREVGRWVKHVACELRTQRLMASAGGPVILVQLENEYSMVSDAYGDEGARYLQWMADLQRELDLGVPAIMCYGAAEGVMETINSFAAHLDADELRRRRPEQPLMWTECWTGWYDVWGAATHRRASDELAYTVARFFAVGGAGVNYYMWMGGTNWGREGMYLQKASYDYDAPVDEFYRPTPKAAHLAAFHKVLLKYQHALLGVDAPREYRLEVRASGEKDEADRCIRAYEWGGVLVFYCNDSDVDVPLEIDGVSGNEETLRAKSVQVRAVSSQELMYDSSSPPPDNVALKIYEAVKVSDGKWQWEGAMEIVPTSKTIDQVAALTDNVRHVAVAHGESGMPPEQLKLTRDASDYCYYVADFEVLHSGTTTMTFEAADFAHVYVDGQLVGRTDSEAPWEDRFTNKWTKREVDPGLRHEVEIEVDAEQDAHISVTILVVSLGLVKGDWQLADGQSMEHERKGLLSDVHTNYSLRRIGKWHALPMTHGECSGWDSAKKLPALAVSAPSGAPRWSATDVLVPYAKSWTIDLGDMGKGLLWVNGTLLARYWNVRATRGRCGFLAGSSITQTAFGELCQREYHIPGWVASQTDYSVGECMLRIVLFDEFGCVPHEGVNLLKVAVA